MYRINYLAILLLVGHTVLYSQYQDIGDNPSTVHSYHNMLKLPQGHILDTGFRIVNFGAKYNSAYNISNINPALLDNSSRLLIGLSFLHSSTVHGATVNMSNYKRVNPEIPQSLNIAYRFKNVSIAYGFNQKYNGQLFTDKMEVVTEAYPDGTGEYFKVVENAAVYRHSIVSALKFVKRNSILSLGVRYSRNIFDFHEVIYHIQSDHEGTKDSWSLGLLYDFKSTFQIGLIFEDAVSYKTVETYKYTTLISDSLFNNLIIPFYEFPLLAYLPSNYSLGFGLRVNNRIKLISEISNYKWKEFYSGYRNVTNSSLTMTYWNGDITYSIGYNQSKTYLSELNNKKSNYLTIGLNTTLFGVVLDLDYYNNYLFSDIGFKQQFVKIGFGYSIW